ncbi:MarR family winged helix-turn-helix transcriptional regulator [Granulicella arctica]|uniref:MarR family winged helix-turn-helix transcriptional regulator n=1 Tax=Granulicella arctica TaxID=940613 RepID=UPI0037C10D74
MISRWVRTTRDQAGTPTSAQLETLSLLQNEGPASIAALARRRWVKHQSMRLLVEQLAAEETILKTSDPQDRRSQIVSLTAKGRSLLRQEQRVRALWIAQVLQQNCSTDDLIQVVAAIDTLDRVLQTILSKPA